MLKATPPVHNCQLQAPLRLRAAVQPARRVSCASTPPSSPRLAPELFFTSASHPTPRCRDVELVTQVSLDRWPRFEQQALAWGGPASVAVYLPCPADHPLAPHYRRHLQRLVDGFLPELAATAATSPNPSTPSTATTATTGETAPGMIARRGPTSARLTPPAASLPAPRLTVSVLHSRHLAAEGANVILPDAVAAPSPQPPPSSWPPSLSPSSSPSSSSSSSPASLDNQQQRPQQPTSSATSASSASSASSSATSASSSASASHSSSDNYERLYPINALRNAALAAARSSHVFLVDGDFIPSAGLRADLLMMSTTTGGSRPTQAAELMTQASSAGGSAPGADAAGGRGVEAAGEDGPSSSASSSCGGGGGSGGGSSSTGGGSSGRSSVGVSGGSLLEQSDTYDRPVMWVVPAFEVMGAAPSAGVTAAVAVAAAVVTRTSAAAAQGLKPSGSGSAASAGAAPVIAAAPVVAGAEAISDYSSSSSSGGGGGVEVLDSEMAAVPRTLRELTAYAAPHPHQHEGRATAPAAAAIAGQGDAGAAAGATLRPFHCGRYPQLVSSVDYNGWLKAASAAAAAAVAAAAPPSLDGCSSHAAAGTTDTAAAWSEVPYHEYFEPYGVTRRDQVPLYDERFRGYGLNKVQHAYHMAAAGFEFRLLSRHFCVTVPHARSASYRATFGTAADPQQRLRVEALYDMFKQEIYDEYGYQYGVLPVRDSGLS